MKRRHILWIGLFLYVASFFLIAVVNLEPFRFGIRGYSCANSTLLAPWDEDARRLGWMRFKDPEYIPMLISGWINPAFLIALAFASSVRFHRVFSILRTVLIVMFPFCWVVFRYEDLRPREGHFVWIVGMLLALFSKELAARVSSSRAAAQGLALI